jgi:hypothetical protein
MPAGARIIMPGLIALPGYIGPVEKRYYLNDLVMVNATGRAALSIPVEPKNINELAGKTSSVKRIAINLNGPI